MTITVEGDRTVVVGARRYPFEFCACSMGRPTDHGFHGDIPLENGWRVSLLSAPELVNGAFVFIRAPDGAIAGPALDDVTDDDLHLILAEMAMWPTNLGAPSWAKQGGAWRPAPLGGSDDPRRPRVDPLW